MSEETVLCPNGHENPAGQAFCGKCGASIAAAGVTPAPDVPAPPLGEAEPPTAGPDRRRALIVGGAVAAVVLVGIIWALSSGGDDSTGATGDASPSTAPTVFRQAYDACASTGLKDTEIGDDDTSLIIDGAPDILTGEQQKTLAATSCILNELDAPDYIVHQMDSTNSLMGEQTGEWNGIEASWSYHPDNGFDLVLHLNTQSSATP